MNRKYDDERVLIDFITGRCEGPQDQAVRRRLEMDKQFREHHDDLARLTGVVGLVTPVEPPADLVSRTLDMIRQKRQTDALLAREGLKRPSRWSGFALRTRGDGFR